MSLATIVQTLAVFLLAFAAFKLIRPDRSVTRGRAAAVLIVGVAVLVTGATLGSAASLPTASPSYLTRVSPSGERLFAASIIPHGDSADLLPGIGGSVEDVRRRLAANEESSPRTVIMAVTVRHDHAHGATARLATLQFDARAIRQSPKTGVELVALASAARIEGDENARNLLRSECEASAAPVRRSALCRQAMGA